MIGEAIFALVLEKYAAKILEKATSTAADRTTEEIDKYWTTHSFRRNIDRYYSNLKSLVGHIKILGMSKPVELRNLYINVNFLSELTKKKQSSVAQLEYLFDQHINGADTPLSCQPGLKVIVENDYVTVLGKPGAGKTTFLKYIALSCTGQNPKIEKIPLFISLNEFVESGLKLQKYIERIFINSGFEKVDDLTKALLSEGAFILLLDGLDEVQEAHLKNIITEVKDFTYKYNKCKYVISCRTAAYNYLFSDFLDVEIADFNSEQTLAFIDKFFFDQLTKKRECIESLNDPDNASIKHLCSSPLLLTLLCIAFDDGMEFPTSRVELYEEAIETLLKKWDTSRQIKRDSIYKQLTTKKKKRMLQEIAYSTFKKREYFFKKRTAIKLIGDFVEKMGTGIEDIDIDADTVLRSMESQHGLITERAYNIYSFSHLTFHEYFTASYICQNTNFSDRENLINGHLNDSRYREIFLLVVGLLDRADEFLEALRKKVTTLAIGNLLFDILKHTDSLISKEVNYPTPIKRAIALNSIISSIDTNYSPHNREFQSFIRTATANAASLVERICEIYSKYFFEDINKAEIKTVNFGESQVRSSVTALTRKIELLNPKELDAYLQYIQASKLLMDCMAIDCLAERSTKKQIIESFLIEKVNRGTMAH